MTERGAKVAELGSWYEKRSVFHDINICFARPANGSSAHDSCIYMKNASMPCPPLQYLLRGAVLPDRQF